MGAMVCKRKQPTRVLIQGLDAAGKTSMLYRLKLGEVVTTIPTIGFNVESISTREGLEINAWDLGGRDKIRPLYRHYYSGTQGFIYVVDSTDVERMDDAMEELHSMILHNEDTPKAVVMVLANKQDLDGALSPADVEARVKKTCDKCRLGWTVSVFVMPCSVITGGGLQEAFDLFVDLIKKKRGGKEDVQNGIIPSAWETATANQKAGNKDDGGDVSAEKGDSPPSVFHRVKTSLFKDPLHLLKSVLFY